MTESNELKILFVEDTDADFELAESELQKNKIRFVSARVETGDEFRKALNDFKPDLVISDYSLPQFNGMQALKISKEYDNALPFIVLTGTLNEEIAVECMKAGANDYVIKEHIGKLSFAVNEALGYRYVILEKTKAEAALLESELRYRSMFENSYAVMLLIDNDDGKIIDVNPAATGFYGYNREEFRCKHLSEISVDSSEFSDLRIDKAIIGNKQYWNSKHKLSNGIERDVEIFFSPLRYKNRNLIHCIIQDITEKNEALEALQKSLNEKKELIREIYHRTKNSMQVIISMFSLQSIFTGDKKLEIILKDMENRIRAMSLVHEKLYQSKNLSKLDLKDYLTDLISNIMSGYGISRDKILITNKMENVQTLIDTAVPCGLVINELVSNVAKYSFPGDRTGELLITLTMDKAGEIELIVSDNATVSDMNTDFEGNESMGLQIVRNIVEYQLNGNINLDRSNGTRWTIRFKDNLYEERI